jgi:hypothetical protein
MNTLAPWRGSGGDSERPVSSHEQRRPRSPHPAPAPEAQRQLPPRRTRPLAAERRRPAGGAADRSSQRPVGASPPGARRRAGNAPGSSHGPRPPAVPQSRSSSGAWRSRRGCRSAAGTGPRRCTSWLSNSTMGGSTTATSPGCPSHSTPSSRPTTAGPTSASEPPTSAARSGVPDAHLIDECARGNWRTGEQQEARVRQPRRTCPERPSPVSSSRGSGNWRSAGARAALPCQQDLAHPSGTGGGPEVARPSSTYGRAGVVSV